MKAEVTNTLPKSLSINLNYCGSEVCDSSFSMGKHVRHEYLIHYIIAGSGKYRVNEKEYDLKAGDIFIVFPETLVSYETNPLDPFHFCWFAYSGSDAKMVTDKLAFSKDNLVRHLHSRYSIKNKVDEIINLINSNTQQNDFKITSILLDMFSLISYSFYVDNEIELDIKKEHVEKAVSYIQMNYMLPISVSNVVDYVRLDRTYLSKIFHNYKKMSINKYIAQVRIDQAKNFLEKTSASVKEISKYVGLKDECYFSRLFKKMCGISPLEYRDQVLEIKETKND